MRDPSGKEKRSIRVGKILGRKVNAREKVSGVVEGHEDHGRPSEDVYASQTGGGNARRPLLKSHNGTDSSLEVRNGPIDLKFWFDELHSALRYLKAVAREEDKRAK